MSADATNRVLHVDVERHSRGDENRLRQLLGTLIRNAVERDGSDVTVTVGGLPDGFSLADDGSGIPEPARTEGFEAGYTTADGGTGFGRYIVKKVVDAHGWSVRVTEGEESGAKFEVTGVEFVDGVGRAG